MKTAAAVAGLALVGALCGCTTPGGDRSGELGAAPVELASAPADDGRPTDWKKLQTWQATRGLEFTGDGVKIDPAGAREAGVAPGREASASSVARSAELLTINARTKAMGAARDAVLADPGNAQAYAALGRALITKRKDTMALDAYTTASRLAPNSAPIRAALADAHNRVGDRGAARAQYREALRLDPDDAKSHARLAILEYYAGDDTAAWRHTLEARRLGADVPPQFIALLTERTPQP